MTFQAYETSDQDSSIVSFYEVQWGATIWRYNSSDRDLSIGANLFTAVPCWDDGVIQGGDSNNDMTIHLPSSVPLAALFQSTPPANTIRVTVRRRHSTDPDQEAFIHWKGYLANVKRDEGNAGIVLTCNTLLSSFSRQGLRLGWTRGCPHVLYDQECRVNPEDFAAEYTIVGKTGNMITVNAPIGPEYGWATGGYVEWDVSAGTIDRRGVAETDGAARVRLLGTTARLEVGMTVRVYPGCNLSMEMCRSRFNNRANYGGCKQMTGKNPFDGTPII